MIICLDTETTGLDPRKDEILELAIVDGDGNKLLHKRYRPTRNVKWPQAQAVHGISPEDVKDCQTIDEDREEILGYLNAADLVVGYNLRFDLNMLWGAGIYRPDVRFYDVMPVFAKIYGKWNPYHRNYRWQKLVTAAAYYNYKWEGKAHGAWADALATLFVYGKVKDVGGRIEMGKGAKKVPVSAA